MVNTFICLPSLRLILLNWKQATPRSDELDERSDDALKSEDN